MVAAIRDEFTRKHLEQWLDATIGRGEYNESEREKTLKYINAALTYAPELLSENRTWREIEEVGKRLVDGWPPRGKTPSR